jgi:hypothetical protein
VSLSHARRVDQRRDEAFYFIDQPFIDTPENAV